jgi:hypothetical protein
MTVSFFEDDIDSIFLMQWANQPAKMQIMTVHPFLGCGLQNDFVEHRSVFGTSAITVSELIHELRNSPD